ncbi:Nitrogen permease regulator 2 [Malassezia yamatoensis]|uniref:Nitrogen permease regulator 2 n=1 Tax=Malassezia yamatoensis TaxID=253288 RepID=A0AAJ5YRC3_9BASI|nr:Nitrogen permease regulator 2 [Malassezia yamatoensis]
MMQGQALSGATTPLPRLEAVFLAIFHPLDGPKVLFQVPENTFTCVTGHSTSQEAHKRTRPMLDFSSLSEFVIPKAPLCGRLITCEVRSYDPSPHVPRSYKVMGFPVMLKQEEKYQRNCFIFNLCFVLDSRASVSAYEPIVRKCGRSLQLLEEESSFVSRIENLPRLYTLVEQLYEDLNAYYEAFIALPESSDSGNPPSSSPSAQRSNLTLIDPQELDKLIKLASGPLASFREQSRFNPGSTSEALSPIVQRGGSITFTLPSVASDEERGRPVGGSASRTRSRSPAPHGLGRTVRDAINLKLFPSYPNPPNVQDWDVPVLLINLGKHVDGSWDLTLVRLLPYINGVNHAKRIAQLSDTDISLVKQCIEHLLYYSYAILIDIFQFSNMYAIRPQVARALDDVSIGSECAAYVTLPNQSSLSAPELWRMYTKLGPGRTLSDWAEEIGESLQQVDIRRFVTFGIIKGFLRRIHRYPMLVHASEDRTAEVEADWPRRNAEVIAPTSMASAIQYASSTSARSAASSWLQFAGTTPMPGAETLVSDFDSHFSLNTPGRAELPRKNYLDFRTNARPAAHRPMATAIDVASHAYGASEATSFRDETFGGRSSTRSPRMSATNPVPGELPSLLDGMHSDDELCVRFDVSWAELNRMLQWIGSPYAATDFNRLLNETGGNYQSSAWNLSELRWPWARVINPRSHESGSYFTAVPGRTRPSNVRPGSSYEPMPSHGPSDPFATREVPSRVKLIAM